jgi:dTDP-4-dehydrorhamnose reductase
VLDLARRNEAANAIDKLRPEMVINCAAFHNVPHCEDEPGQAFQVNATAVRDLAAACVKARAWLVNFSSDYVFGGARSTPWREDDPPSPLQIYGISRLAGELAALSVAPQRTVVIRTCGLYGAGGGRTRGGNFVDMRVADALRGDPISMACEQVVSPTSAADLAAAVYQLIAHPALQPGVYHLVNEGACSWYELTCEIVRLIGAPVEVLPVDRGGRSGTMRRPLCSALANTRASALGIRLRPWQTALAAYLGERYPG